MDDRRFGQMLEKLLQADLSTGTEAFRDELLARCLTGLDSDARDEASGSDADCHVIELDDGDLELLAAAGDAMRAEGPPMPRSDGHTLGHLAGPDA